MPEYRFTLEARNDLQSIVDYTQAHWGKEQAHKYVDGLEELAAHLAETPSLGVKRDTLISNLISFPYVSHVLYYVPQDYGITIIRVLHKSMDFRRHFEATESLKK